MGMRNDKEDINENKDDDPKESQMGHQKSL